ncbi:MAG: hypothetical protein ACXADY_06250 [Candidatus Hodarchaeales archaeon]|jgi:hypothetical protein
MDIQIIALIAILVIVTFFSRSFYGINKSKNELLTDSGFHLDYIRSIKENNHKLPEIYPRLIPDQKTGYPFFYHYLLSFLPEKSVSFFSIFSGGINDCIQLALWSFLLIYTNNFNFLTVLALIIFSVASIHIKNDARTFSISARPFGNLLINMWLIFSIVSIVSDDQFSIFFFGLIAGICFSLTLISSKFATQVLLFQLPIFLLFLEFPSTICSILIGFFIIVILRFNWLKRTLMTHYLHSRNYQRTISKIHSRVLTRTSLTDPLRFLFNLKLKEFLISIYNQPIIIGLIRNPAIFFFPFGLLIFFSSVLNKVLLVFVFLSILPWILTSMDRLSFLGEADRYLEYSLFPSLLLIALNGTLSENIRIVILLVLLSLNILFSVLQILSAKSTSKKKVKSRCDGYEFLKNLKEPKRIMAIPNHAFKVYLSFFDHKWFLSSDYNNETTIRVFNNLYRRRMCWPEQDALVEYVNLYQIDYIIISKPYFDMVTPNNIFEAKFRGESFMYDFSNWNVVKKTDNIIVLSSLSS